MSGHPEPSWYRSELAQCGGLVSSDVDQVVGKAGHLHLAGHLILFQLKQGRGWFFILFFFVKQSECFI